MPVEQRGRLVAGVSQDTLLFGFLNPLDGQIEGFDIDVLHQIAQAIFGDPNKIEYRAITTADRIPKILDGLHGSVTTTMPIARLDVLAGMGWLASGLNPDDIGGEEVNGLP